MKDHMELLLKHAVPNLIMRTIPVDHKTFECGRPIIRDDWPEQIIRSEGYDPSGKTGLGPVYWRITDRPSNGGVYVSVFRLEAAKAIEVWGPDAAKYCTDGFAFVANETTITS